MANTVDTSFWRFEELVDDLAGSRRMTPLQPSVSSKTTTKTNHRILLVETDQPTQHLERLALQEVVTTTTNLPTYYDTTSLSYPSSVTSTVSPPSSPLSTSTSLLGPSWTTQMTFTPYPTFMISNDKIPLGWLRPSLDSTSLLEVNQTNHPSHFVFLGFGKVSFVGRGGGKSTHHYPLFVRRIY
ncbi:hypothetical protein BC941DRAFT_48960 [Chlamydoabsidia padenii]|nr:hypothetical protein BC941DRAFT_48960 [Chlamydoabsidia padenii]